MSDSMQKGVVVCATGSWYDVLSDEGAVCKCRIRGRMRLKGVRSTNPIVVGDEVLFTADGEDFVIEELVPRRNYIIRRASNLSKESHIIASNIDRAMLVVTLSSPRTAPEFVDRFLITCEAYSIPATILLAKIDLAADKRDIFRHTTITHLERCLLDIIAKYPYCPECYGIARERYLDPWIRPAQ
jgi:ribosome biogenesis GTPase